MASYGNVPTVSIVQLDLSQAYLVRVPATQSASINGEFGGSASGCGVLVHNYPTGTVVGQWTHDLGKNPDPFSLAIPTSSEDQLFYISAWGYYGDYQPHARGWFQQGPSFAGPWAPQGGRVQFVCPTSPNGATTINILITLSAS
jgi:hypothetical protein